MLNHFFTNTLQPILNGGNEILVEYLRSVGVLKRAVRCPSCNILMNTKKYSRNSDGFAFRCMTRNCQNFQKYFSVRAGSFFEGFNVPMKKILYVLFKWLNNTQKKQVLTEIDLDKSVISKIYEKLSLFIQSYFVRNPVVLGGDGVICQVDESLFRHKPKYHRGRAPRNEKWVFGIADKSFSPAKIYLELVDNRRSDSLLPIISRVCRPGTIIHSDQWRGYNQISSIPSLSHATVNHSLHFIDPQTYVHTQNIESFWSKAKLKIKASKGIVSEKIPLFLEEMMWKHNVGKNDWQELINLIKII